MGWIGSLLLKQIDSHLNVVDWVKGSHKDGILVLGVTDDSYSVEGAGLVAIYVYAGCSTDAWMT